MIKRAFWFIFLNIILCNPGFSQVLVMTDSQPFLDQIKEQQGQGTISTVYNLLYQRIGVPQKLVLMPLNRQNREFDQTEYAVCSLYRFKNEVRAKKYAFSQMVYFMVHYNLYQQLDMPALDSNTLNNDGHVKSLQDIAIHYSQSKLLHIPSYSYGDLLDKQINALPESSKASWAGISPHNRMSNLFFAKRADFALMFPAEVASYIAVMPNSQYRKYRIAGVNYATKGYMMCNKHKDSYAYIAKVNEALQALYQEPEYLEAHLAAYSENEHVFIKQEFATIHQ